MARHNIPVDRGKHATQALAVILDDTIDDQFDVVAEDVPQDLPKTFQNKPITWVNNFTVRKKPNVPKKTGSKITYTVELDQISGQWVYYDPAGGGVQALQTRSAGNRLQANLAADDPPIGHT